MAGASGGGRSLEQTPTWAVALVCFVLVLISIIIEHIIHLIGKWFKKKRKKALYEALEKIKSELMLLGFISLLLTVGQGLISNICIPENVANTWHPCKKEHEEKVVKDDESESTENEARRRLLSVMASGGSLRRILATSSSGNKCEKGKVPFVSSDGIHQLHIFIFVLAVFHVLYCILTMALGRAKMRSWKRWEKETRSIEYQFTHDPERFRFARETSFGRRHLSFWTKNPILIWIVSFFRQFVRSVPKVDYLTLRHGFIMAHLAPHSQTRFDFQKYINRSLEEDWKDVVGIGPPIWFIAVLFILFNTYGWYSYLWLPFIPLIVILLVGTKLQVIITKMGLSIQERGEVVKGVPVVQVGDYLFWFNRPRLMLYLINFVLFQNAFQLAFFVWTLYEFGLESCYHEHTEDIVIRITMGVVIQILCSYVTLPLYALVTQMGSNMKPAIFDEKVAAALRNWHQTAKKHVKQKKGTSVSGTPYSSRPATPTHNLSPVHLLRNYRSEIDSVHTSPRRSNFDYDTDSPSPSYTVHHVAGDGSSSSRYHQNIDPQGSYYSEYDRGEIVVVGDVKLGLAQCGGRGGRNPGPGPIEGHVMEQHEIEIGCKEFSFDKRNSI